MNTTKPLISNVEFSVLSDVLSMTLPSSAVAGNEHHGLAVYCCSFQGKINLEKRTNFDLKPNSISPLPPH